jgi:ATP-dependent Lon protease
MVIVSPTLISLSRRNVTKFIEVAMQRFIPAAYNKRQRQELDKEPSVPVFICTTAFPYVPCPLHIYEPRYKLMVRRAIESGERKFGIALLEPGRQRYVEYGTMLDIRDCLVLSDGGSILSTVGMRRFRVLARGETDGYDTANVEFIKDEPIDESKLHLIQDLHRQVWKKAKDWHDNLPNYKKIDILKSFGKMPDLEEHWEHVIDGPAWAWWIIAILPLHPQLKVSV